MLREDIIKMFEDLGCRKCTQYRNDPDSIVKGLLDAEGVILDIDVYLKGDIKLKIFCQGILDFTDESYAGFKETIIYGYDNIEKIELGQSF